MIINVWGWHLNSYLFIKKQNSLICLHYGEPLLSFWEMLIFSFS